ncbi:MAG: hypothetical protein ACK5Q5_22685 [Planctomycetaceae bacterium]
MMRTLNHLPRTATREILEAAKAIAIDEAGRIRGRASTAQQRAVAPSVRARSDRFPAIIAGGARRAVSGGGRVSEVFFGAEFGGRGRKTTQQFQPHRGTRGYFVYPTFRADEDRMMKRWEQAVKAIEREWSGVL